MQNEDQVSELAQAYEMLKDKLKRSQRKLRIIKVISVAVIILLLILWFSSLSYIGSSVQERYSMKDQVDTLKIKIELLEGEIEESRFYFYYRTLRRQRFGIDDLESYLDRWHWIEGSYVENKFDCSEMSAYIERNLENEGYRTWIVIGNCPFNQTARHAWLLVETSSGKSMPVEATQYALVKRDNPYFDLYFEYDHWFETILDALEFDSDEFNWWKD